MSQHFDTFADLAKRKHAQVKRCGWTRLKPRYDGGIWSVPSQLGQNIGVNQVAHRDTSLLTPGSRSNSSSFNPRKGERCMNAASDSSRWHKRSNVSRERITATHLPCIVISCGPSSWARFTSSDIRAFASSICQLCIQSSTSGRPHQIIPPARVRIKRGGRPSGSAQMRGSL
jgi:hypothetical protein